MANQEHLDLLKQGIDVWNKWRRNYPDVQPDLTNANLSGTQLVLLDGGDVIEINFSGTNLSGANLWWADLVGANLSNANLSRANLMRSQLTGTNLNSANMQESKLNATIFDGTHLKETNFSKATLMSTIFVGVDLSSALGLETIIHDGPSSIGLDTIYHSRGQIPEAFLRGAGVPETFIDNMRALAASMSPIEFYSCFISYSHHNEDFAKRLHADLLARGVRCWFADEDLKIGDHYHQRIDEAIRLYDKLIIVLSETAVRSTWVEREVIAAREKEERQGREVLFPIRLDEAVMQTDQAWAADVRRRWHIGDFTRWKDHDHYQQTFDRLLHDLNKAR